MKRKLWLAKWAIRVVVIVIIFFVTVIIARWMASVDRETNSAGHSQTEHIDEHTTEIEQNAEEIEQNADDIQELKDQLNETPCPTPTAKPGARRHSAPKRRLTPRPWWSKLINP